MVNILLSFSYNVKDMGSYEKTIAKFESNKYVVHCYEVFGEDFAIEILYYAIQKLREEYGNKLGRIVVLSNIRHGIFTWYRCFNYLVNDFIYFFDESGVEYIGSYDNPDLIESLASLSKVEFESINGKIFTNFNSNSIISVLRIVTANYNYKYFDKLDNFQFSKDDNGRISNAHKKIYLFKSRYYTFEPQEGINTSNSEVILIEDVKNDIPMKDDYFNRLLNEDSDLFITLTNALYRIIPEKISKIVDSEVKQIISCQRYEVINKLRQISEKYLKSENLNFIDKVFIHYIISTINRTPWEF